MDVAKRLIEFLSFVVLEGTDSGQYAALARSMLFVKGEEDTAVYVYGPYDIVTERHHESDLVIRVEKSDVVKVRAIWQGANIALEGNFPEMGWDKQDGEFGLGGDWWKGK